MNQGAPADILTPRELADLKSKVFALNLSISSIHQQFMKLIKMKWPRRLKEFEWGEAFEIDPLANILKHYGDKAFIKAVEDEYKRFLVLKCVESRASKAKLHNDTANLWSNEPIQPGPLVDLFWHAHILATKQYTKDCLYLVGDIIEYSGGPCDKDDDDDTETGCGSMSEQHKTLFRFEQSFLKQNYICHCSITNEPKWESLTTRSKLFGTTVHVEEMMEKYDILEHEEGEDFCPNDDDSIISYWFMCHGSCCPHCCSIANKFENDIDDY